jgi:hypothetical protein
MPIADNLKLHFEVIVTGSYAALGGIAQVTKNILHYRRSVVNPTQNNSAVLAAWELAVMPSWLAAVSLHWTCTQLAIRCIDDAEEAESITLPNDPGLIVGEAYPSYVAMVFSKKSALRGRMNQGRLYVAGVAESAASGNALVAGQIALNATLAAALIAPISSGGSTYVPAVLSPTRSQTAINPTTVWVEDLVSITGNPELGSMNSRKL